MADPVFSVVRTEPFIFIIGINDIFTNSMESLKKQLRNISNEGVGGESKGKIRQKTHVHSYLTGVLTDNEKNKFSLFHLLFHMN